MLNIIPMVTTKKIDLKCIQKEMMGELKPFSIKKKSIKHEKRQ